MPIDQLLQRLIQDREIPNINDLYAFSDLTLQDAEVVRQQWELVDVARRRSVVADLVELAQEDIDLHLSSLLAAWSWVTVMGKLRQAAISGLWDEGAPDLLGPLVQTLLQ